MVDELGNYCWKTCIVDYQTLDFSSNQHEQNQQITAASCLKWLDSRKFRGKSIKYKAKLFFFVRCKGISQPAENRFVAEPSS